MINLPFYYWFGTQGRFLDHVCSCQCHHVDFAIDPLQLRSAHEHCSHLPESKGQTGTRQTKTLHLLKWLLFSFDCLVLMCLLCNAKEKVSHLSFLSSDKKKKNVCPLCQSLFMVNCSKTSYCWNKVQVIQLRALVSFLQKHFIWWFK